MFCYRTSRVAGCVYHALKGGEEFQLYENPTQIAIKPHD